MIKVNNAIYVLAKLLVDNLYVVKDGEHMTIHEFYESPEVQNVMREITKE